MENTGITKEPTGCWKKGHQENSCYDTASIPSEKNILIFHIFGDSNDIIMIMVIIMTCHFYKAPTLYDFLQHFTLKLLPRTLTSNPSAARHISALSLGYGCAPW